MNEFESVGKFEIAGRGTVYSVVNPSNCTREELGRFLGDVKIDGSVRRVIGVESHCIPNIKAGAYIGLLVRAAAQIGKAS